MVGVLSGLHTEYYTGLVYIEIILSVCTYYCVA